MAGGKLMPEQQTIQNQRQVLQALRLASAQCNQTRNTITAKHKQDIANINNIQKVEEQNIQNELTLAKNAYEARCQGIPVPVAIVVPDDLSTLERLRETVKQAGQHADEITSLQSEIQNLKQLVVNAKRNLENLETDERELRRQQRKRAIWATVLVPPLTIFFLLCCQLIGRSLFSAGNYDPAKNFLLIGSVGGLFDFNDPGDWTRLDMSYTYAIHRDIGELQWWKAEWDIQQFRYIRQRMKDHGYDGTSNDPNYDPDGMYACVQIKKAVYQNDWASAAKNIASFTALRFYPYPCRIPDELAYHEELRQIVRQLNVPYWPPNGVWRGTITGGKSSIVLTLKDCDFSGSCGKVEYPQLPCSTTKLGYVPPKDILPDQPSVLQYEFEEKADQSDVSCGSGRLLLIPNGDGFTVSGKWRSETWSADLKPD
jgi:hypothetical protein